MEQASFLFSEQAAAAAAEPARPAAATESARAEAMAESSDVQAPRILSVSEVVRAAKGMLEGHFADVWLMGEVSTYRPSGAGHLYFDLKDADGLISAVCFRNVAQGLTFRIENGMELIGHGRLSLYEKTGKFQIILDHCEPQGIGALQLAFEQLKRRLDQEGLFDPRRKKSLPILPRRIGIVTSPTGAAIRDILQILRRRHPGAHVLVAPARVQGAGAGAEIAEAIALLDARGECDVLIVGRGGGSMEDLWAFNEEAVARAIAAASTPIVSAVGHEIDFTIADFAADVRAPTPSAAAELVAPIQAELLAAVAERRRALRHALTRCLDLQHQRFTAMRERVKAPTARFPTLLQRVDQGRERLVFGIRTQMERQASLLQQRAAELQHLSPLGILAKGYAVVCKAGSPQPIRSAAAVAEGERIFVRLAEGALNAEVRSHYDSIED
ncbi:MAG: exodeoxyribonuclease VII large subunit [Deltaproteobacteria bacterium]|nr:exodeoxyribonuclease VII large subunit [Deltaproteobacteria bacterium]